MLAKRQFDLALSGVGLILSVPVWAAIALMIWFDDGWPILIRQERAGRGGRPFVALKFRSMVRGAERMSPKQDLDDDARVTRLGRWLRATALDELPQLWNIFVGDMSFVGPRALAVTIEDQERVHFRTIYEIPGFVTRNRVPPGLTGVAQIYASKELPRRQKFRYDLLYVRRCNFWLDLRLIALSFWITFRGKWEHRGQKL